MKIREVIELLNTVNPEAEFDVIAMNRKQPFEWTWGSSDGCTKKTCDKFGPYLTDLNDKGEIEKPRP